MEKRTLPHSIEAERGVLGSMLISPRDVIGECVEQLQPECFYLPAHQMIYGLLVELWQASEAIDLITFTQVLRDRKMMATIGGEGVCESLYTFVPTAANLTYYLEIVIGKFVLRQIIAAGTEHVRRAFEDQDDWPETLGDFERAALAIRPSENSPARSMKELTMEAIEYVEKVYDNRGALTGLSTGFIELDRMTSGLQNTDLILIAARPSMGKTALAMNIAEHVAIYEKKPVGIFSLEMSSQQLVNRLLCSRARVNLQKVRDGFLSERDFPNLTAAASKLAESQMHVDDEGSLTVEKIVARARRMKHDHDIRLLVVDYINLVRTDYKKAKDRQQEIGHISNTLKGLAKELKIPVIVLCQFNRNPEARHMGKPRISDLRDSGTLEQDADVVTLLYRPEVYCEDEDERYERAGEAELIIAKQRNGPIGEIPLTFLKEFTRFEDRARMLNN